MLKHFREKLNVSGARGWRWEGEDTHAKWSGKKTSFNPFSIIVSLPRGLLRGRKKQKANCLTFCLMTCSGKSFICSRNSNIFPGKAVLCRLMINFSIENESKSKTLGGSDWNEVKDSAGCELQKTFPPPKTSHNSPTHPDPQPSPPLPLQCLENKSLAGEFNNIYCIRAIRLLLREKRQSAHPAFYEARRKDAEILNQQRARSAKKTANIRWNRNMNASWSAERNGVGSGVGLDLVSRSSSMMG